MLEMACVEEMWGESLRLVVESVTRRSSRIGGDFTTSPLHHSTTPLSILLHLPFSTEYTIVAMPNLTATYTASASDSKIFEHAQAACPKTPSTEERTIYIASLRSNLSTLQDQVNAFLTEKMEEDKSAAVAAVNDEKEEENYGEEVVD
jgi:hypothetical protein